MTWETIADGTERLEVPGGHLIRSAWRSLVGPHAVDGSAMVFVPAPLSLGPSDEMKAALEVPGAADALALIRAEPKKKGTR